MVCDRYLPSSLVLQGIDGIESDTVWLLNAGVYVPDVAVLLNADHSVIAERLRQRGALTEDQGQHRLPAARRRLQRRRLPRQLPKPDNGDYGVMIASRIQARTDDFGDRVGYLASRAAALTLPAPHGPIQVIGAYVPSRDASAEKTERKRTWLAACTAARNPTQATVFLGDLNVLEPGHQPRYKFFAPFEYDFYRHLTDDCGLIDAFRALHPDKIEHSWVGRTGDGCRYNHVHCTTDLATTLLSCDYHHQTRLDRLSDHSALSVRLAIEPSEPLITSAPATAGAPPTLF